MAEDSGEFSQGAQRYKETVGNKDLNPQKPSWKQKIAGAVAGLGIMGGAAVGADKVIDANQEASGHARPVGPELTVNLHPVTNNQEQNIAPVFREDPNQSSKELTTEELKSRGIDVTSGNIKVREVKGSTYPSQLQAGLMSDEKTGENYGIWGEIVVDDPNTGEEKPTGIYLSKNFYTPQEEAAIQQPE